MPQPGTAGVNGNVRGLPGIVGGPLWQREKPFIGVESALEETSEELEGQTAPVEPDLSDARERSDDGRHDRRLARPPLRQVADRLGHH